MTNFFKYEQMIKKINPMKLRQLYGTVHKMRATSLKNLEFRAKLGI